MKRALMLFVAVCLVVGVSFAGEVRTTPRYLVLTEPTTNQVELISQTYFYGDDPHLVIKYNVLDSNGSVRSSHSVTLSGSDFATFVSTFVATMRSNGDAAIWADIQSKFTLQDTP